MLMIEFCGVPGAGKTTLLNLMCEHLKEAGLNVANRQEIYFYKCKNKRKYKALIKAFAKPQHYNVYYSIIKLNRNYSKKLSKLKYALQFILFISQMEEVMRKSTYEVILIDEGIYQYLSAQADEKRFYDEKFIHKLIEKIKEIIPQCIIVNCVVDVDESITRIQNRDSVSKRFLPNSPVLREKLEDRKFNIDMMCKYKCDLFLNMNRDLSENEQIIMKYLKESRGMYF